MTQTVQPRPGADAPIVHPKRPSNLPWPLRFYSTAVGKKWVMAVSGIALMGFVFAHMVGNLKMYLGAEDINDYARALRELLHPIMPNMWVLWGMRMGLILMLLIHLHAAATLTMLNKRSRPTGYQSKRDYIAANFASRSMRISGFVVLAYIIFHLLDLTIGKTGYTFSETDVYGNLVASLSRPPVAIFYLIANALLALHLYHGAWSIFQSLGVNSPQYNVARRWFAIAFATIVGVANCLFPVMILAGVVK